MRSKLFLILLFATLFACAQKQKYVSILESCEYKKALNRTEYMRFPYGKAYIDGKWTKKDYLQSSRQQLFVSEDSVALTIAFCDIKGFDFNKKPRKKGFEFLKAHYSWDTEYWLASGNGMKLELVESDSIEKYIVYRLYNDNDVDNNFLTSECNGIFTMYSVGSKWSHEKIVAFLKKVRNSNFE